MIINSLPCCNKQKIENNIGNQHDSFKLLNNLTELFNDDINLESTQILINKNKIQLYLNETFIIGNFIYNEIYSIEFDNKKYYYKPISTIYLNYILLDSIQFILDSIYVQKQINEMIKIIPIIVFYKDKDNNIICGYLIDYVEAERISEIIYEPLYWYFYGKTINQQIYLLLDNLTKNRIRPFNLTYNDFIWNKKNNSLYYIGLSFYPFYHPFNNNKIKMHNDMFKVKLKEVEMRIKANFKFIDYFCFYKKIDN